MPPDPDQPSEMLFFGYFLQPYKHSIEQNPYRGEAGIPFKMIANNDLIFFSKNP